MMQLFIEGNSVDINENISTLLTFAIDDIKDFGAKNTTFSKTIVLPGTKKNNALFGNVFEVTAANAYDKAKKNVGTNFNAAVAASAYIFNDNVQCFKGIVRLMMIVIDNGFIEYEVSVYGELGGFVAKLAANKLTGNLNADGTQNVELDLDFSVYNHAYSIANISGSWDNAAAGSGYYYPLMDYGTYGRNAPHTVPGSPTLIETIGKHSWKYRTFRPALFVAEYLKKIFEKAGYTYDFPLMATTRFKSLIVPHNQKKLTSQKDFTLDIAAAGAGASYDTIDGMSKEMAFPVHTIAQDFTYNAASTQYTYNGAGFSGRCQFRLKCKWMKNSAIPFSLEWQKNGIAVYSVGVGGYNSSVYIEEDSTYNFSIALAAGDVIKFVAKQPTATSFSLQLDTGTCRFTIANGISTAVETLINGEVIMNATIPKNILQKDFFSSIIKLFNIYVYEDPLREKHLIIKPFTDFFNAATSIDWSNKVDRGSVMRVKPMSELNARYYEFKSKDDSDFHNDLYKKRYNESYGSLKYDSKYEFSKDQETVEVIFSGTPLVGYAGEDKVYSTIFKQTGTSPTLVEENTDSNIRILQAKKMIGVASWDILADDGITALRTGTDYGYAGHLDSPDAPTNDINFGVPKELFFTLVTGALNINQFNVYYSSYLAEVTNKDSRLMTCTMKLEYKDIYNLDFGKYIYIDGNLYRLNAIRDFNATREDNCTAEFIKLINKIY